MRKISIVSRSIKVAAVLAVAAMLGASASGVAQAEGSVHAWSSYDDQIAQANKVKAQQQQHSADLESAVTATDTAIADATLKLQQLNDQLPGVQEEYRLAQQQYDSAVLQQKIVASKLTAAQAEDAALTTQISSDDVKITDLRNMLAEIARAEYQGAQDNSSLSIFFGATTTQQFVDDYAYRETTARVQASTLDDAEQLAAVNRNRKTRQAAVKVYIAELMTQADALVVQTKAASATAAAKKAEMEKLLADTQDLKTYLDSQKAAYLAQQAQLDADAAALTAELDTLWKNKRAEEAVNGTGSLVKGFLSVPIANPYITSPFGMRFHPIFHVWRLHSGTDFGAACGTQVTAAADGTVAWAKYMSGSGNQVLLDHGYVSGKWLTTSYNHLSKFAVSPGQKVARGQIVGYVGSTGDSTGCHLHFEVRVNNRYVDPMTLLAAW
ncbi:M23 family metallopeptidase [Demequina lutea]|uniref:Murein DD-endopeptidase MepM/ murein hydrolase activator NlpD n=1 Tax=Demequina lutea TaxID=431489 RepID=A0A7Z0CKM1_9MICO|nr:M23 family metallopeptidase [Demequina lutea]NYI42058.1 murein DD-endopeptidase MepM/ murein hydrolase activator NlpD [Demequina lutea]